MKKSISFIFSAIMCIALCTPAWATNDISLNNENYVTEYVAANSISADIMNTICNRITLRKSHLPQTQAANTGDSEEIDAVIAELASELSDVRDQIKQLDGQTMNRSSSKAVDSLVAQEERLEDALAELDTTLLTDEDLTALFANTDYCIHIEHGDNGISPTSTIDWPSLTTTYSNWTLTNAGTSYGRQSCYISAWPKNSRSTLWAEENDINIRYPYLRVAEVGLEFLAVVGTAGESEVLSAVIIPIVGEAFDWAMNGFVASLQITEKLTAKLAYVYDDSSDMYVNTLITHSDAIYYNYYAELLKLEKDGKCGDAVGQYYSTSTMMRRANSNFNGNPNRTEIDHSKYFEVIAVSDGRDIYVGKITPIYITSGSQVN